MLLHCSFFTACHLKGVQPFPVMMKLSGYQDSFKELLCDKGEERQGPSPFCLLNDSALTLGAVFPNWAKVWQSSADLLPL